MEWLHIFFTITLALSITNTPLAAFHQQPPLPSSFYGTVVINDENIPTGTTIQAVINGQVVATCQSQFYKGVSVYTIDVPGDDRGTSKIEGGIPGDTISFYVKGLKANENAFWHSGTNVEHNLTVLTSSTQEPTPDLQTPTRTPINPSATIASEGEGLQTSTSYATKASSLETPTVPTLSAEVNTKLATTVTKAHEDPLEEDESNIETFATTTNQSPYFHEEINETVRENRVNNENKSWRWVMTGIFLLGGFLGVYWVKLRGAKLRNQNYG